MATSNDLGHSLIDGDLTDLEMRISEVYQEAYAEMYDTTTAYFESFKERDAQQQIRVQNGEISQSDYTAWRLNQMGRGERYEAMSSKLAERYTTANEVAVAYVNDATPGIYSIARNYTEYTIDQQTGNDNSFTLWDEQTVKNLIVNNPDLMPYYPEEKAVARGIDLAYGKEQITAAVTSGILQGKSVGQISQDLQTRIRDMNQTSAIRAARTAVTTAENAGRQDSYEEATKMGIEMEKRWVATLDDRTREAHQEADGQVVPYDEPFVVDGEELMFPGDDSMGASGANIYNCRCTMIAQVKDADMSDATRWAEDSETGQKSEIPDMTYQEWLDYKADNQPETADGDQVDLNSIIQGLVNDYGKEAEENRELTLSEDGQKIVNSAEARKVKYKEVERLDKELTSDEIVQKLAGADKTKGSCSSLAFAYAGNQNGLDVTDYRGGTSQDFFSQNSNIRSIATLPGVNGIVESVMNEVKGTWKILNENTVEGATYYLATGKHAAIVQRIGDGFQYLEMQSKYYNGFKPLTQSELRSRFGCTYSHTFYGEKYATTVELIDTTNLQGDDFQKILGYINTDTDKQMKGAGGGIK